MTKSKTPPPDLVNDVTRFLLHPGTLVSHPSLEFDLQVVSLDMVEGQLNCGVIRYGQPPATADRWVFRFSELWPGGVVTEALRIITRTLVEASVEDAVARLQDKGQLLSPDMTDSGKLARSRRPDKAVDCGACECSGICGSCGGLGWVERAPVTVTPFGLDTHHADHCSGCDIPEDQRVNLPEGWQQGDTVPHGLTLHRTLRDLSAFVFIGDPERQRRFYFVGAYPDEQAEPTAREVHHLQPHAEYVMEPGGVGTKPADPPLDAC
jgi:hypothetical protein